ncbi:FtsK/SpoIIIE family DNA translocase [Aquimarina rhabdastrellae]
MAKRKATTKKTTVKNKKSIKERLSMTKQQKIVLGTFLFLFGIWLFFSFTSFFFNWKVDQSELVDYARRDVGIKNSLSSFGAQISNFFIYRGFGISAFIIPVLTLLSGVYLVLGFNKKKLIGFWYWGILLMLWGAVLFGFFNYADHILGGVVGFEFNDFLSDYIGKLGTVLLLIFFAILYVVVRLKLTPEIVIAAFSRKEEEVEETISDEKVDAPSLNDEGVNQKEETIPLETEIPVTAIDEPIVIAEDAETTITTTFGQEDLVPTIKNYSQPEGITILDGEQEADEVKSVNDEKDDFLEEITMEIEETVEEEEVDTISDQLVKDFGEFDPRLELGAYAFPTVDLLKDYTQGKAGITIDQGELEENKNRIVETLKNYKIEIAQIKATVGPTVTLYEIVPEAGIRISKIKNLEDDIALSLAALGIRIIAPIPGKGTIGIEVPNKNSTIVSMRSAIMSPKFQNAEMELPLSLGKTISNETLVVDLAKMPHLLMAGATGQGKSVGLNAILTSLLYKKHPAEVKFVLVDPKKVELTLYNKIERHFLAKLPDAEDAIITDNSKVINTLNSLCIEMDARYDLLKNAMVRNIKEYNAKFKARKLNPENGHRFLPYIVLVIDEFADLIMTAGKEVETPIARLAQLARAIGIHLIIATQRPSVNVITGMIKANFPARIAFRVTSKIDSRTILDTGGADQLIGRGDMLYTQGNDVIRIQCAFVDTPEVERITEYIGGQKAYASAHLLPEFIGEDSGTSIDIDKKDRDKLFNEAAEIIVTAQQGSASLLQRKLKLGYNRAGRLIDQLEAAGIVGPFEGSKARQVLVTDLNALHLLLEAEK